LSSIDAILISIFDGHGGNQLAEYAKNKMGELIDELIRVYLNKENKR
jgi:serine/threonine protein phosphatase PrpC